jgi:hypothetical protein
MSYALNVIRQLPATRDNMARERAPREHRQTDR